MGSSHYRQTFLQSFNVKVWRSNLKTAFWFPTSHATECFILFDKSIGFLDPQLSFVRTDSGRNDNGIVTKYDKKAPMGPITIITIRLCFVNIPKALYFTKFIITEGGSKIFDCWQKVAIKTLIMESVYWVTSESGKVLTPNVHLNSIFTTRRREVKRGARGEVALRLNTRPVRLAFANDSSRLNS